MIRLLLALLACAALSSSFAADEETPPVQRYLANLVLGDSLDRIQRIYPPAQEWNSVVMPRGRVTRIRVDRENAKTFPNKVETMWLGMKRDRLVEVQLLYDAKYTRKKSAEQLAADLALIYGVPERSENKFWWSDGRTVLRVFNAEVPLLDGGAQSKEFRTSIQILEYGLFERTD